MIQVIISRDGNVNSVDSNVPLHEVELLTILLDSVLHVSAKIARTHNCQDPHCECQSFASKVNNIITNGLKKEIHYGPSGPGNTTNQAQIYSPKQGPSGPTIRDINTQLDKWLRDIREADEHSSGNSSTEERRS